MKEETETMLTVVTATVDPGKTLKYWSSWRKMATVPFRLILVVGSPKPEELMLDDEVVAQLWVGDEVVFRPIDGTVNAFLAGLGVVEEAGGCEDGKVVACFHDDMEIMQAGWDAMVKGVFSLYPKTVLAGFGGGKGLGSEDIYNVPYNPMQLARQGFVSNMRDAEAHGRRGVKIEKLACTDGFAMIGRDRFLLEAFQLFNAKMVKHHAYDSWTGALARQAGLDCMLIPVACHHAGGVTAVGSEAYQSWARSQRRNGDMDFWEEAHRAMYEECRGILPFRVE